MEYAMRGRYTKMQHENDAAWDDAHDIVVLSNVPSQAVAHTLSSFAPDRSAHRCHHHICMMSCVCAGINYLSIFIFTPHIHTQV